MPGLRELWSLGDAQSLSPAAAAIEQIRSEFMQTLRLVNETLRALIALAPKALVDELGGRRDALYSDYQQFLSRTLESPPEDGALSDDGGALLSRIGQLDRDASGAKSAAEKARQRWDSCGDKLEAIEDQLAEADDDAGNAKEVTRHRRNLNAITAAANRREYRAACQLLERVASEVAGLLSAEKEPAVREPMTHRAGPIDPPPVVPTDPKELENWQNPLVQVDPRQVFKPERMDEVADMHFEGESTPENNELNKAMKAVLFADENTPDEELFEHVKEICRLRGIDDEQVARQQYERFKQVRSVNEQLAAARGEAPDEALTTRRDEYLEKHGDFLGTRSSLRYGQVVGDAMGLDPALAAMLNPTGGMVGWGMDVIAPTDANSPIVLHGIFHDAGGYLLNSQNTGPGYTYLEHVQPESGERGDSPIQGQVEGVSYWYERRGQGRSVFEDMLEPEFTAEDPQDRQAVYDRFVKQPIEDTEAFINELTEDRLEEVRQLVEGMADLGSTTTDALKAATEACGDTIQAGVAEVSETLESLVGQARELGVGDELVDGVQRGVSYALQSVNDQLETWEQGLSNEFDEAGAAFEQGLENVSQWATDVGSSIRQATSDGADALAEGIRQTLVDLTSDKDLQDFGRRAADLAAETGQDLAAKAEEIGAAYADAKAQAIAFYDEAVTTVEATAGRVADGLAAVRDGMVQALSAAGGAAAEAIAELQREVDEAADKFVQAGQDLVDAAGGVVDSLGDAVGSGVDTIANALDNAGEHVAGEWNRLITLFG